eukprot:TRINITY_DN9171_c0_g4_i1.p2 TRINITY_DN9171_c0_g4~~TRINITY_DN9171_c0_g4_i1.p2  ORF type:complete len:117 (-),score=12.32 TRINITY_DN9171_c0_g4_i1:118-468(-)
MFISASHKKKTTATPPLFFVPSCLWGSPERDQGVPGVHLQDSHAVRVLTMPACGVAGGEWLHISCAAIKTALHTHAPLFEQHAAGTAGLTGGCNGLCGHRLQCLLLLRPVALQGFF